MQIFIAKDKQQTGPFSEEQIRGMLAAGMVSPTDLAWHDQLDDWIPLDQVLGAENPNPPPNTASIPSVEPEVTQAAFTASEAPPRPQGNAPGYPQPAASDLIYPPAKPRSVGWMTFWGFIWPGLGQLLCGQTAKGIVLMILSFIANIVLSILAAPVLPGLTMCIVGAIDANWVAGALARGKPVRRWAFFPK